MAKRTLIITIEIEEADLKEWFKGQSEQEVRELAYSEADLAYTWETVGKPWKQALALEELHRRAKASKVTTGTPPGTFVLYQDNPRPYRVVGPDPDASEVLVVINESRWVTRCNVADLWLAETQGWEQ